MRRAALLLITASACGGSGPSGAGDAGAPLQPISGANLVLVTLDTLRADHLGCYGYFRDTSPILDAFAEECVLFERCVAPMATTLPSHTSMLTGVWPAEHGVLANLKKVLIYERDQRLATLTEVFKAAGYETGAFLGAFPLRAEAGLADGFDVYDEPKPALRERSAAETTDLALEWLAEPRSSPYFLWVHYFDTHSPYEPHPETGEFETDDELRAWLGERAVTLRAHREVIKRGDDGLLVDAFEVANDYDEELRYVDHHLGRLLAAIRAQDGWERTVVAIIGDHGDGLNQHEQPGHGYIWNEQLEVPFLVRAPGLAPRRVSELVSVVDLADTLLAIVDVPGRDAFLEQTRGTNVLDPAYRARPILAQTSARRERTDRLDEAAIVTGRWKYVRHGTGGATLFDTLADPFELRDVSVLHPGVVEELAAILERELAEQRARCGGTTREATAEELQGLNDLGYGGGGDDEDEAEAEGDEPPR